MLVTDAISALGLEEGIHQLGQFKIEIRKGSAYIAGTDILCGSIAEIPKCVRNFKEATGKFCVIITRQILCINISVLGYILYLTVVLCSCLI